MAASGTLSHSHAIRKSGVVVLNGYGIRVQVNAGHLLLHDGIADERRTIRLPRVNHGLKRLLMIGSDGFITLEALRWISDVGAAFVMLDRRGKVLTVTGPVAPSDSKLRRSQALALGNGIALKISKELISQKLAGQELLVREMLHDSATADAIARFRDLLSGVETIERVTLIEALAAKSYWHSWADLPILWPRKEERSHSSTLEKVWLSNFPLDSQPASGRQPAECTAKPTVRNFGKRSSSFCSCYGHGPRDWVSSRGYAQQGLSRMRSDGSLQAARDRRIRFELASE